jgi:hypothetical protein
VDTYREMCEKIYVELNESKSELDEAKILIKDLVDTLERIGLYSDLGGKYAGEALEKHKDLISKLIK